MPNSKSQTTEATLRQRLGDRALEAGYPKAALYEEVAERIMSLEDENARLRAELGNLNRGLNKVRQRGLDWRRDACERIKAVNAGSLNHV